MAVSFASAGLTLLDAAPAEPSRRWWRAAAGLVLVLLVIAAGAASLFDLAVAERRRALSTATQARLQALAHGRAEVLCDRVACGGVGAHGAAAAVATSDHGPTPASASLRSKSSPRLRAQMRVKSQRP